MTEHSKIHGGSLEDAKEYMVKNLKKDEIVNDYGHKILRIKYLKVEDCGIFEDGSIFIGVRGQQSRFKKLINPYLNVSRPKENTRSGSENKKSKRSGIVNADKYIGRTNINLEGTKMTIVGYRGQHDIDVMFEDGRIAYHKRHRDFKKGAITIREFVSNSKDMLTKQYTSVDGYDFKVTELLDGNMCTVRFEDGMIKKMSRCSVNTNSVAKYREKIDEVEWAIINGKELVNGYMVNGLKIILDDIDDENVIGHFLDGSEIKINRRSFSHLFHSGRISHPTLKGKWKGKLASFDISKLAYKIDGDYSKVFYECKCRDCGHSGVMTPHEMVVHSRNEHGFEPVCKGVNI